MQLLAPGRPGQGGRDVAGLLHHLGRDVSRDVLVHQLLGRRRNLGRDHHGQRLVLDLDELRRVLGEIPVFGDDEGDRLARVAHDLGGEAALRAPVGQVRVRDEKR